MKSPLTLFLLAILVTVSSTACTHNLFNDRASSQRKIIGRYYDDDSAFDTTANRRRTSDTGFGFPTGLGSQQ